MRRNDVKIIFIRFIISLIVVLALFAIGVDIVGFFRRINNYAKLYILACCLLTDNIILSPKKSRHCDMELPQKLFFRQ